jgi:hypothetical protein
MLLLKFFPTPLYKGREEPSGRESVLSTPVEGLKRLSDPVFSIP